MPVDFAGKKLLILGANAETIPILNKARELGIITYVTDHIENSPAKTIADGFYNINGLNIDSIIALINREHFDSVMLGVAEPLAGAYYTICKRLKLPCMVDEAAIELCGNKSKIKQRCSESGISVVKQWFASSEIDKINVEPIVYPIVVKPEVSRGGNGVSICFSSKEFPMLFLRAKNYSDNEVVIGEQYIEADDCVATFLIVGDDINLIAMYDRHMMRNKDGVGSVTYGCKYESKYVTLFKKYHLKKFEKLIRKLGINIGILNIQMFKVNDDFIPYDVDCILNGENTNNLMYITKGIDLLGNMLCYALSGDYGFLQSTNNYSISPVCKGASVWIICRSGKIERIYGKEKIENKSYYVDAIWRMSEGSFISKEMENTEKATVARIWIKADSEDDIKRFSREIRDSIVVVGSNGEILNI